METVNLNLNLDGSIIGLLQLSKQHVIKSQQVVKV